MKHPTSGNRGKIFYNHLLKYVAFEEIIAAFKYSIFDNRLDDESMQQLIKNFVTALILIF